MKINRSTTLAATLALLLTGGLAACTDANKTAGQKLDAAVATTENQAEALKADAQAGGAEVKETLKDATTEVKQAIGDAGIVAGINAELAKDSRLSALKIDVDSKEGRVSLQGTAPDAAAKAHATQLAAGVSGVMSVDNQLTVK